MDAMTAAAALHKVRVGRSPAYPFISLEEALRRAEEFRRTEGKHSVPLRSAYHAWKIGEKTGAARQTAAALGHFGLFSFSGNNENRQARLSDLALKILLDTRKPSTERDAFIREAALKPAIHKEMYDRWEGDLPSLPTMETYLVRDRGFSHAGALLLITEYRDTLRFADLLKPDNMSAANDGEVNADARKTEIEVGDLIQVEINGAFALEKPQRVRAVQEHEGRRWVFIETSATGVPMEQASLVEKGMASDQKPRIIPPTLSLEPLLTEPQPAAGEKEWLRGSLGRDVSYRLIVAGDLGPKEIGKLITLLEAQKAVLSDDADEDD